MRVVQETPNLIRLTRWGTINSFLVREADGFSLVDANLAGSAAAILKAAEKLGAPIRRILLTHAHIDHVGSLDRLREILPNAEVFAGVRESRLLAGDFSLDPGESGKRLIGFIRVVTRPTQLLQDGDRVGSLQAVSSPGHTPGHISFFDTRDGSLVAGDAFTTQLGVVAAGAVKVTFPMAALFCWNRVAAAESARRLCALKPTRLATGHGKTTASPLLRMERALELALRQSKKMLH